MTAEIEVTNPSFKTNGIVNIAASLEDLKNFMVKFKELKSDLLDTNDVQIISNKPYVKKSGWLKFSLAFNLKTEIIKEERETFLDNKGDKQFAYHFTVRCIADNGRITEKVGSCDSIEKNKESDSIHIIRSMAETRANNRAISAMVGAGEVSAEEMNAEHQSNNIVFCTCEGGPKTKLDGTCNACGKYSKVWFDNHPKDEGGD